MGFEVQCDTTEKVEFNYSYLKASVRDIKKKGLGESNEGDKFKGKTWQRRTEGVVSRVGTTSLYYNDQVDRRFALLHKRGNR